MEGRATEALKSGDYTYARTVALVEIAESLARLADYMTAPMYHNVIPTHWVPFNQEGKNEE